MSENFITHGYNPIYWHRPLPRLVSILPGNQKYKWFKQKLFNPRIKKLEQPTLKLEAEETDEDLKFAVGLFKRIPKLS